jgi:hypothetical protein
MQNSERDIATIKYQLFGWVYFILVFGAIISLVHYFQVSALHEVRVDEVKHYVKTTVTSGEVKNFDECAVNPDARIDKSNPKKCITANNQIFYK